MAPSQAPSNRNPVRSRSACGLPSRAQICSTLVLVAWASLGLIGCRIDRSRSIDLTPISPGWRKDSTWFLDWEGRSATFHLWVWGPSGDRAFLLSVSNKEPKPIRLSIHHPRELAWDGVICPYYTADRRGDFVEGDSTFKTGLLLRVGGTLEIPAGGSAHMLLGTKFYDRWPPNQGDKVSLVITTRDGEDVLDSCPADFAVAGFVESVTIRKTIGH